MDHGFKGHGEGWLCLRHRRIRLYLYYKVNKMALLSP